MATIDHLPLVIDRNGSILGKPLSGNDINYLRGWYVYLPDIQTDQIVDITPNYFTIPYLATYPLFDKFSGEIVGGSSVAYVKEVETYICPQKASGAVNFADITYGTYPIGDISIPNLAIVRDSISHEPFVYTDTNGNVHDLYLLVGYTADVTGKGGDPTHYFYWVYFESESGITRVPNGDVSLPAHNKRFDIWIGATLNFSRVPWEAGLTVNLDSSNTKRPELTKKEITVQNIATQWSGETPIDSSFNILEVFGENQLVMGYLNGIAVNCSIKPIANALQSDDIILSPNYPFYDVYWNGSARAVSNLGDLQFGDVIRLIYSKKVWL